MDLFTTLLLVTSVIWLNSAAPLPQRGQRILHDSRFINILHTNEKQFTTTSRIPSDVNAISSKQHKGQFGDRERSSPVNFDFLNLVLFGNKSTDVESFIYDYDILDYIYSLDFLDFKTEAERNYIKSRLTTEPSSRLAKNLKFNPSLETNKTFSPNNRNSNLYKKYLNKNQHRRKINKGKLFSRFRYTTPLPNKIVPKIQQEVASDNLNMTDNQNKSSKISSIWRAESSISVEVRVESSQRKSSDQYLSSTRASQISENKLTPSNDKNKKVLGYSQNKNNMQLRDVLELELSATPVTVSLKDGATTPKSNILDTQINSFTESTKNIIRPPISLSNLLSSKMILPFTTKPSQSSNVDTQPLLPSPSNIYIIEKKLVPNSPPNRFRYHGTINSSQIEKWKLPPRLAKTDRISNIPLITQSNISTQDQVALDSEASRNSKSINSRPKSFVGLQLGVNPYGYNPSGLKPFGVNPIGASPFGSSPQGLQPQGNLTTNTNLTSSTISLTEPPPSAIPPPNNSVTEERYHVQVKKPDGSINGDYLVLNPTTGSLSGVRYEAIDGADQDLIQKALLSFLSLDPRLDPSSVK